MSQTQAQIFTQLLNESNLNIIIYSWTYLSLYLRPNFKKYTYIYIYIYLILDHVGFVNKFLIYKIINYKLLVIEISS